MQGVGRPSARGRGRGEARARVPEHCVQYKLVGKCDKLASGQCHFRHDLISRKTYKECLEIPAGMSVGRVIGRGGCNMKRMYSITKSCRVEVEERKVSIITNEQTKLPLLVEKMQEIFSQESFYGSSRCYINARDGSGQQLYLFRPFDGHVPQKESTTSQQGPLYEVVFGGAEVQKSRPDDRDIPSDVLSSGASGGRKTPVKKKSRGASAKKEKPMEQPQQCPDPQEEIKENLSRSLLMLLDEKRERRFIVQISARLGTVLWSRKKQSAKYNVQHLVELLSDGSSRNSFSPIVKSTSADCLESSLQHLPSHSIEVIQVKGDFISGARGLEGGTRLIVHLVLRRGPKHDTIVQVVTVKRHESREISFDVLNLPRKHDVRIGVYNYEYVTEGEPLHAVVREMVKTLSFPSRYAVHIQPKMARWNIHSVLYKNKTSYILDSKFAATVSKISEYTFDVGKAEVVELDLRKEKSLNVEVHNLAWECAFGHDAGFSSNQSLALLVGRGSCNTREFDVIPRPWKVESIVGDFHTFWAHLEALTDSARLDDELDFM